MASPQRENGHVDIANEIVEQLARVNLCAYEWRVLWAVLRKTWGWQKKLDRIAVSQIVSMTGLRKQHASRARRSLLAKKVLIEQGEGIGFNKDYEQWEFKGLSVTNRGDGVTDSGYAKVTDLGDGVTNRGDKTSPIEEPQKKRKKLDKRKESGTPPESLVDYWKSKSNLPQVRSITSGRRKKLVARFGEPDFSDHWREIIDKVSQSAFCTGDNDRGWRVGIDWLLANETNYVKVLEGKYDNPPKPEPQRGDIDWLPTEEEAEAIMRECGLC